MNDWTMYFRYYILAKVSKFQSFKYLNFKVSELKAPKLQRRILNDKHVCTRVPGLSRSAILKFSKIIFVESRLIILVFLKVLLHKIRGPRSEIWSTFENLPKYRK